jgi:alanine dehydrogenase
VNTYEGTLTCEPVAVSLKKPWKPVRDLLG